MHATVMRLPNAERRAVRRWIAESRERCRLPRLLIPAVACLLLAAPAAAPAARPAPRPQPEPALRIPVAPLGYLSPSRSTLLDRESSVSLDFIDDRRLLFTFHKLGLLQRSPDSRPEDEDRLIHAVVIDLTTQRVTTEADWRVHDPQRYLWPLGHGNFFVRERNALFLTDAALVLRPYATFPGDLRALQLSPDGNLFLAQSDAPPSKPDPEKNPGKPEAGGKGEAPFLPPRSVEIRVIRTATRQTIAVSHARVPLRLPLGPDGLIEALSGKGPHWIVRYNPFQGASRPLTEVDSACTPRFDFLGRGRLMMHVCPASLDSLVAIGMDMSGRQFWTYRWDTTHVWPFLARDSVGSRFAYGFMVLSRPAATPRSFGKDEVVGQEVDVLDAATGSLLLHAQASPVIDAGQNFALSPDGSRFAILNNGAIEVFDLPPATPPSSSPPAK